MAVSSEMTKDEKTTNDWKYKTGWGCCLTDLLELFGREKPKEKKKPVWFKIDIKYSRDFSGNEQCLTLSISTSSSSLCSVNNQSVQFFFPGWWRLRMRKLIKSIISVMTTNALKCVYELEGKQWIQKNFTEKPKILISK